MSSEWLLRSCYVKKSDLMHTIVMHTSDFMHGISLWPIHYPILSVTAGVRWDVQHCYQLWLRILTSEFWKGIYSFVYSEVG